MSDQVKLRLKLGPPGKGNALTVEFAIASLHEAPIYVMTRATDIRGAPQPHLTYLGLEEGRGALHAFLGKPPAPWGLPDAVEVLPFSSLLQPGDTYKDHFLLSPPVLDWHPCADGQYGSSFPMVVVDTLVFSTEYFVADRASFARKVPDCPPFFLADAVQRKTVAAALLLPSPIPVMRVTDPSFQLPFPRRWDPPAPPGEEPAVGGASASMSAEGIPEPIPPTPEDAPLIVTLPEGIAKQLNGAWKASIKGGAAVQHGIVLVRDDAGGLGLVNPTSGSADSILLERHVPPGKTVLGVFRTRPYSAGAGGHTGVSLSAADAVYLIENADRIIIAQSGNDQFLFMRTRQTPSQVDRAALTADYCARIGQLLGRGEKYPRATQEAAGELARKLQLAYYKGNKGAFRKDGPS